MSAWISPPATAKSMPSSTLTGPNDLLMPVMVSCMTALGFGAEDRTGKENRIGIRRRLTGADHRARIPRELLEAFMRYELDPDLFSCEPRSAFCDDWILLERLFGEDGALGCEISQDRVEYP